MAVNETHEKQLESICADPRGYYNHVMFMPGMRVYLKPYHGRDDVQKSESVLSYYWKKISSYFLRLKK